MGKLKMIFALAALLLFSEIQAGVQQAKGTSVGFGQPTSGLTISIGAIVRKTPYDRSFKTNFFPS